MSQKIGAVSGHVLTGLAEIVAVDTAKHEDSIVVSQHHVQAQGCPSVVVADLVITERIHGAVGFNVPVVGAAIIEEAFEVSQSTRDKKEQEASKSLKLARHGCSRQEAGDKKAQGKVRKKRVYPRGLVTKKVDGDKPGWTGDAYNAELDQKKTFAEDF